MSLPEFRAVKLALLGIALLGAVGGFTRGAAATEPGRVLPVTVVTDAAFRELPNWRGLARGAVQKATEDLGLDAGLYLSVAGEETWEPPSTAQGLNAVLAAAFAAVDPSDGILAVFLGTPPAGLPSGERGYAFLGEPGFLVFAPGAGSLDLGHGPRDQLALFVRHELGHVFGIPHLSGANVMTAVPEGRAWSYGDLGIEILRANRGFAFGSDVPFAGCALDTLRDVYLLLDERGEMELALFLDLARAYRARGDAPAAEALYGIVLRRDRESRAAGLGLAHCEVARGDSAGAWSRAQALLGTPLSPRDQVDLGALYNELRRYALAESVLAAAVARADIPEGWWNLGLARQGRADGAGAAQAFRRYVELEPKGSHRDEALARLEGTQTR